jgi:GNAT superfamily N-acetyltransferase
MILRKATFLELSVIWDILQQATGYPNEQTCLEDITNGYAYVLVDNNMIIAYAAIIFGVEPAYNDIKGKWLTYEDYVVVHRVATSNAEKGKGIATRLFKLIEDLAIEQKVYSIKVDTNFDNVPMLKIMEKLSYTYCGEVFFNGAARKAFEKVIS